MVRAYALETLAEPGAASQLRSTGVIDETGFLKRGKASCGVGRQHTESAGKITNCQVGVFAASVSGKGHAFIDRALYLPKDWTKDPARMRVAHVPEGVGFAAKPRLALNVVERAIAAGLPFAWVAAGTVYGTGEVETALCRAVKGHVLGTNAIQPLSSWFGKPEVRLKAGQTGAYGTAEEIARGLDASAWQRLSAGEGTKGARLSDWAYLELVDLDADEFNPGLSGIWTRGLLIRRNLADVGCAYFSTWCPAETTAEILVAVEGRRWAIEDAFETTKNELGLVRRTFGSTTTTRLGTDTAGTATCPRLCWPSPCWLPYATARTRRRPQKRRHGSSGCVRPHPLVGPGGLPHRHPARATAHPPRAHHRLVALATSAPSRCATLISKAEAHL